jgi:hypothetical protein
MKKQHKKQKKKNKGPRNADVAKEISTCKSIYLCKNQKRKA